MKKNKKLFVILLVAFLLRLAWAFLQPNVPLSTDAQWYQTTAEGIARGLGYNDPRSHLPTAFYSPGYSYFLGFFYFLFGPHTWIARLLNVLLTTAMVALVYRLGRRFLSSQAGLIGALIMALFPSQIFWAGSIMSEPLFGFLGLLALDVAFGEKAWRGIPTGVFFALLILVRSQGGLLGPFLLLGLMEVDDLKRSLISLGLFAVVATAFLAPWLWRNEKTFGHPVLTNNVGVNLLMGVFPGADGSYMRTENFDALVSFPEHADEYQVDQAYLQAARRLVRENPLRLFEMVPKKIFVFLRSDLSSLEVGNVLSAEQLWALFKWGTGQGAMPPVPAWKVFFVFFAQVFYSLVLLFALLGLGRKGGRLLVFGGIVLVFTGFHALYVAPERYHFFLIPFFALMAAQFFAKTKGLSEALEA
ncbi:MAG TPA: hypothetical protein DD435_15525 [Cyanobacteria bacterium UBA8530]|nr:hypothetical protein [Cyanobacteria bacterium UBA8530]